MDELLDAERKLAELLDLADDVAALLTPADRDTQERLARIKRDAETIRRKIPATMAAA